MRNAREKVSTKHDVRTDKMEDTNMMKRDTSNINTRPHLSAMGMSVSWEIIMPKNVMHKRIPNVPMGIWPGCTTDCKKYGSSWNEIRPISLAYRCNQHVGWNIILRGVEIIEEKTRKWKNFRLNSMKNCDYQQEDVEDVVCSCAHRHSCNLCMRKKANKDEFWFRMYWC